MILAGGINSGSPVGEKKIGFRFREIRSERD